MHHAPIGGRWLNERGRGLGNGPWVGEWRGGARGGALVTLLKLNLLKANRRRFSAASFLATWVGPGADTSVTTVTSQFLQDAVSCLNRHSQCGALFRLEQSRLSPVLCPCCRVRMRLCSASKFHPQVSRRIAPLRLHGDTSAGRDQLSGSKLAFPPSKRDHI